MCLRTVAPNAQGRVPIIPLLQGFQGKQWRAPRPGEVAVQLMTWEHELGGVVAGAGFYRRRDNPNYKGIHGEELPGYVWEEAQAVCRHLSQRAK